MKNSPVGFITKPNAAKFLGCTIRTVDNWMRLKIIPYYKVGRAVFFKESDLLLAMDSCKQHTPANTNQNDDQFKLALALVNLADLIESLETLSKAGGPLNHSPMADNMLKTAKDIEKLLPKPKLP